MPIWFGACRLFVGAAVYGAEDIRRTGTSNYPSKAKIGVDGVVQLSTARGISDVETTLKTVTISGLSYAPGCPANSSSSSDRCRRYLADGGRQDLEGGRYRAWRPVQVSSVASTAGLQDAGAVGLWSYLGSTATNAPLVAAFDSYVVEGDCAIGVTYTVGGN